ncbi:peptidase [Nocardia mangyaensis]|uniref:peptidase n=1 Tax=Nocardia mangyaensis TaxID=2213200 RepID=UPI0026756383|nr:peptidase [Nocardia mangyaensis]MDO3645782.1 peptidase [Nocardia mangyaensis]
MYRTLSLAALALLTAVSCGGDDSSAPDRADLPPPPSPVVPAQPPEFWSTPATTEEQRAMVAQATRQVDVCALLPRDVLDELDHVHSVTVGLDSCRAILDTDQPGQGTTLTWHSTLLDSLGSSGRGTTKQFGDASVRLVPDRDAGEPRSCGATARFPSGAAFYLGLSTPPGQNPCEVADGLMPGMLDRWRESPPQGTSPDTVSTVLLGADPCEVRERLEGTAETGEQRLTTCLFTYRGERVTVSYEYRVPDYLGARGTEERIDDHPVYRSVSIYDSRIPMFTTAVGPELPADSTQFGTRIPVVEVVSVTDDVGRDVMGQVLTLFPQG